MNLGEHFTSIFKVEIYLYEYYFHLYVAYKLNLNPGLERSHVNQSASAYMIGASDLACCIFAQFHGHICFWHIFGNMCKGDDVVGCVLAYTYAKIRASLICHIGSWLYEVYLQYGSHTCSVSSMCEVLLFTCLIQ